MKNLNLSLNNIKSRCKTKRQMTAFNELISSFAVTPDQLVGEHIDDHTKIIEYIGKFNSVEDAMKAIPTELPENSLIYKSLKRDGTKLKKASVLHLFGVEYIIDFEDGSWRDDFIILTGKDLTELLSSRKDDEKAERLVKVFEQDLLKLNKKSITNALWKLCTDLLDNSKFNDIDDEITELFGQCNQVTRYKRGWRSDKFDW